MPRPREVLIALVILAAVGALVLTSGQLRLVVDPCTRVANQTVWPAGVRWKVANLRYDLQPGPHYSLSSARREARVLFCELSKESSGGRYAQRPLHAPAA